MKMESSKGNIVADTRPTENSFEKDLRMLQEAVDNFEKEFVDEDKREDLLRKRLQEIDIEKSRLSNEIKENRGVPEKRIKLEQEMALLKIEEIEIEEELSLKKYERSDYRLLGKGGRKDNLILRHWESEVEKNKKKQADSKKSWKKTILGKILRKN